MGLSPIVYRTAEKVGTLNYLPLRECSGVVASLSRPSFLWMHNDSGDRSQLFAFTFTGDHLATLPVQQAQCIDWEDITTLRYNDQPYIAIADVGDNRAKREQVQIYLVADQACQDGVFEEHLTVDRVIEFSYQDGPHDCESIGFDQQSNTFLLITKSWMPFSDVYALKLPESDDTETQVALPIARLKLAGITGLDIAPDGTRAVAVTYAHAYEFSRASGETWGQAFQRSPREITLPPRRQGEAICYGHDGVTLYTTSEGMNAPLIEIRPKVSPSPRAPDERSAR